MATISSLKEKIRSPFAKGKENTRKIQLMLEETLTKNVQLQRVNNQTLLTRQAETYEQIQISHFQCAFSVCSFPCKAFYYETEWICMKMNLQIKHLFMCLVLCEG